MFRKFDTNGPRRLISKKPEYVLNEVVLKTKKNARNDDLPHYLNVASGFSQPVRSYGDNSIDSIIQRLNLPTRSISRAFLSKRAVKKILKSNKPTLFSRTMIEANFTKSEDSIGVARTYRVSFETEVDVRNVCSELNKSNAVEEARPNYISRILTRPSDEFYGYQWGLPAIKCEEAWEIEAGHDDVVIAIVDSGVDLNHDDLCDKLAPGYDFVDFQDYLPFWLTPLGDYQERDDNPNDEDGHGTHCAGIAGAMSDNSAGVAGVCWGGTILPIRVMFRVFDYFRQYETSLGSDVDIDAGIKFAVDSGANVINLSLGGDEPSHEAVIQYAYDQDVCVIAATGNDYSSDPHYPGANENVLAVGALESNLTRAEFSNHGPAFNKFVMAPGVDIASTYKGNDYVYLQGTSMAAPFVTGLSALLLSYAKRNGKSLKPEEVFRIIRETATPLGNGKGDFFCGEGLVNAKAALDKTSELF